MQASHHDVIASLPNLLKPTASAIDHRRIAILSLVNNNKAQLLRNVPDHAQQLALFEQMVVPLMDGRIEGRAVRHLLRPRHKHVLLVLGLRLRLWGGEGSGLQVGPAGLFLPLL